MAINKNKLIASAQRLTQRGQLDRAIKEYRTIVEHDPDDVRVWMKIGALYVRKGATQHAVATYNRVAAHYQDTGHNQKAAAVYKQIIGLVPGAIDAHLQLAEVLARLGQNIEAVNELQIVVGAYEREARHRDSCSLLARIVELAPDEEANRIRLAEAYARQNDNAAAIREFRSVLGQLQRNQRLDDFIQVAERLLYLAPDQLDTVRQLAEVYLQRSQPKRALSRLQVLFQHDPSDATVLEMLGQAFNDLGYRGKAISVYRELARIHGERGAEGARLDAYRSLLSIDPKDPEALEATGAADRFSSPPRGQAISLSPRPSGEPASDGDQIERYLDDVRLYLKYELTDHAVARLDRVFAIDPNNVEALAQKAALMERLDKPADAARIYRQLADAASGDAAMGYLGKLIELRPDDIDAQARMRALSGDMASAHGKVVSLPPAAVPNDDPYEVELNLDGVDFDDGLTDGFAVMPEDSGESLDFELDLEGLEPAPDDDEFSDLLGAGGGDAPAAPSPREIPRRAFGDLSADDEFGDLLEPDASTSLGASDYEDVGDFDALIDQPRTDDEFGDLLAPDEGWTEQALESAPEPEYGGLLGDPVAETAAPDDDEFGDLLADPPAQADPEYGDLLADAPAPAVDVPDYDGGLLAPQDDPPGYDDLAIQARPSGPLDGAPADAVIALAPPPDAGLLAPEPAEQPVGFDEIDEGEVVHLMDDSFGDLLADLEEEYAQPVEETAEILPPEDMSLEDALAAAAMSEPMAPIAAQTPAPDMALPDVDFGSLNVGTLDVPEPSRDYDGALDQDVDLGALDALDDDLIGGDLVGGSFEIEPSAPENDAAVLVPPAPEAKSPADSVEDLFANDEERALPVEEAAPFDSLLDEAEPTGDFDVDAMALPGVMDSIPPQPLELDEDDDIIELDDDEFVVEDLDVDGLPDLDQPPPPPPLASGLGVAPPPPPSPRAGPGLVARTPPKPPSLRDRLARISGPQKGRPAPPPIPGGNLFDLRTNEPLSVPPPSIDEPEIEIEESLAGAEFFNIGGAVEWPALDAELEALDALLAERRVKEARERLSDLNQDHPGHPALSDRLDRILEIEAGGDDEGDSTFASPFDGFEGDDLDAPPLGSVDTAQLPGLGEPEGDGLLDALQSAELSGFGNDDDSDALLGALQSAELPGLEEADADSLLEGLDGGEVDFGTVQGSMLSELDEDDASTHFDLGVAFKEMGQYKKAIEQLEMARQSRDLYAEATRILAAAHHERGDSGDAVELLREAIADDRVSQAAQLGLRYELAGVFETVGRHAEAAEELRVIAQVAPGDFPDLNARLSRLG